MENSSNNMFVKKVSGKDKVVGYNESLICKSDKCEI